MAIRHVVTRGYGNGTFNGTIAEVVARGYIDTAAATATLGGKTVFTESEIVAGAQVTTITLVNDTWVAAGATFNAQRQAIIDGFDSAQAELLGWNNEVRDKEAVGAVVRTSDTVVTITWTAAPLYDVTSDETITATIPAAALTGGLEITGSPTVGVTADVADGAGGTPNRKKRKRENLEELRRAAQAALLRRRKAEELEARVQAQLEKAIPEGATIEYDPQAMRIAKISAKIDRDLAIAFEAQRRAEEEQEATRKRRKRDQIAVMLLLH